MHFTMTSRFKSDFKKLSTAEQEAFRKAARAFSEACDRRLESNDHQWPASLRVKSIESTRGVFEMTWNFAGPDGRATWEWTTLTISRKGKTEIVPAVQWRRIGGHAIFSQP